MQQACRDCLLVHFQVRQDNRNIQGMNNVGLPRTAFLSFMRFGGQLVGLFDEGDIIRGVIPAHTDQKVPVKLLRTQKITQLFNPAVVNADALALRQCIQLLLTRNLPGGEPLRRLCLQYLAAL